MPLSLPGTCAAMWLAGFSINNLTLMALAISVGFVVDDAIVMIENMFRNLESGHAPMQAALEGARQIGFTVVSISVSLIAAFIPLLFMGGLVGRLLREFAVTLVVRHRHLGGGVADRDADDLRPSRTRARRARRDRFDRAVEGAMDRLIARLHAQPGCGAALAALHAGAHDRARGVSPCGSIPWCRRASFPTRTRGLIFGFVQAQPDTSFQQMTELPAAACSR